MASKPRSSMTLADSALKAPGTITPRRASTSDLSCLRVDTGKTLRSQKTVAGYADLAFHQHAGAAAHQGLGDRPPAVDLPGFGADAQRARGVAEAHGGALAAAGRQVHQRAGDGGRGADGHRRGAHHRVVQLAHGQCAHQQVRRRPRSPACRWRPCRPRAAPRRPPWACAGAWPASAMSRISPMRTAPCARMASNIASAASHRR